MPAAAVQPEDPVLDGITGAPYQALLRACREGSDGQKKKALRTFIDILEEIYTGL